MGGSETARPAPDIDAVIASAPSSGRPRLRRVAIMLALLLPVGFVGWTIASPRSERDDARYVTEAVGRGDIVVTVTASGSVQPTTKVDVSSELSGTIRKVNVDYNDAVRAGQVLAVLDSDKLKAAADNSRAKLAAARARVVDAQATMVEKEREFTRKKALADKQFFSVHDFEAARAAHERAKAGVESARADVGVAEADLVLNETNLAKATILSPIDGVVLKRNVDPGSTVATTLQASTLFTIAEDLRRMELQVDIDEADVGKVKAGQNATFSVDAYPERRFPAVIRDVRFASETVSGVVTYKGLLTIDNTDLLLRPGMTATADIRVSERRNVLRVGNAALRYAPPVAEPAQQGGLLRRLMPGPPAFRPVSPREETGPDRTVWVLRDKAAQAVRIVVGASDGKSTEVVSGDLRPEDAVIVDRLQGAK